MLYRKSGDILRYLAQLSKQMTTIATNQLALQVPASFTVDDRTVFRDEHHLQFVSSIYLPKEATIKLTADSIKITLFYEISENDFFTYKTKSVNLSIGKNSQRVFEIESIFGGASFKVLLNRVEDIKSAILELRKKQPTPLLKKSYDLLLLLIEKITDRIYNQRKEIEAKLFS